VGLDASMFKAIPITERFSARLNIDFFNVLNHPGNPNSVGAPGCWQRGIPAAARARYS